MRKIFILIPVILFIGCGTIHQGVQATVHQGNETWDACSLNIDTPFEYRHTLIFTDVHGKDHVLSGDWRIDYSKVPCWN